MYIYCHIYFVIGDGVITLMMPFTILGVFCILYTIVFMVERYRFDASCNNKTTQTVNEQHPPRERLSVKYSGSQEDTVETPQAGYSGNLLSSVLDVNSLKKYFIACVWAQVWQVINVGGQSYDHASYSTTKGAPEVGGTNTAKYPGNLLSSIMNVGSLKKYFTACVWAQVGRVVKVGGQSCDFASHSTTQAATEQTPSTSYQKQ